MPSFVYLLQHASAPRFKIGKAVDIGARVRQLGLNRFDYAQSSALRVPSEADAFNLEKLLHRAFAKSRIASTDVVSGEGESSDGDTEWFCLSCRPRVESFLLANRDIFEFEPVPSAALISLVRPLAVIATRTGATPRRTPAPKTAHARSESKAALKLRIMADIEAKASAMAAAMAVVLNELFDLSTKVCFSFDIADRRSLVIHGNCPRSKTQRADALLSKLMDFRLFSEIGWVGINVVTSVAHRVENEGFFYRTTLAWEGDTINDPYTNAVVRYIWAMPVQREEWEAIPRGVTNLPVSELLAA
jgi:hypothetical protein